MIIFYHSWAKKIDPYISYLWKRGKVNKYPKSIDLWNIKKQKTKNIGLWNIYRQFLKEKKRKKRLF